MEALFALILFFQTLKGSYSISGVVTNAQTGEPVKGALVELTEIRTADATGGSASPRRLSTRSSCPES